MPLNLQQNKVPLDRKVSRIDYRVFQHAHIQGIPEAIETKQPHQRLIWLVAIIATNIACGIHLYFLLSSFVNEPNETKMTYEPKAALLPPTIIVCQPATRFLDPESVSNISAEYYYALELGVGLIHMAQLDRLQYSLNISKVEEYHQQILSENNGSAAVAYHNFHHKHMRKCEDTFIHCYTELFDKADCCKIFKQVFTLYGMCYAARN
uniref:Uncharacterized protein n=1 Tax=Plectus sambesii TaxID=2011161 RepID=A0A914X9Z3_9BILA